MDIFCPDGIPNVLSRINLAKMFCDVFFFFVFLIFHFFYLFSYVSLFFPLFFFLFLSDN